MNYKNEHKTLLILDLDETLIFGIEEELARKSDFMAFHFHLYKRPYLAEFLQQVKDDFMLAIWSSASDDYVQEVVKKIIPEEIELEFVWGRSRCSYKHCVQMDSNGYFIDNYAHPYHYTKPLSKLKRKGYRLERILIIDDTPHKSKDNFGNAIYPKEFRGEADDNELELLPQYLKTLKDSLNVRRIEKRNWRDEIS